MVKHVHVFLGALQTDTAPKSPLYLCEPKMHPHSDGVVLFWKERAASLSK